MGISLEIMPDTLVTPMTPGCLTDAWSTPESTALQLLFLAYEDGGRRLQSAQINKLAYIAHGFCLARTNRPLFDNSGNQIQAWKYGPVVVKLYYLLQPLGKEPAGLFGFLDALMARTEQDASSLMPRVEDGRLCFARLDHLREQCREACREVEWVYQNYTVYSARELSQMITRQGTPWHTVYGAAGDNGLGGDLAKKNSVIPDQLIRDHYAQLP